MSPPASTNTHEFTGHERDAETGLDYMKARYFSSEGLQRFMSVDPGIDIDLPVPQSWNKYTYVRNNPVNRTDPTGTLGLDGGLIEYEHKASNPAQAQSASLDPSTIENAGQQVSSGATQMGYVGLGVALTGALTLQPEVVAVGIAWSGASGLVAAGGDATAALANPSTENLSTLAGDAASFGAGKYVDDALDATKGTSATVDAAIDFVQEAAGIPAGAAVSAATAALLSMVTEDPSSSEENSSSQEPAQNTCEANTCEGTPRVE